MLNNILKSIEQLPDDPFPEYYQSYILMMQDEIVDKEVSHVRPNLNGLTGLNCLESAINKLEDTLLS